MSTTAAARSRRTHFKVIPVAAVARLLEVAKAGAPAHHAAPRKRKNPKRDRRIKS